MTASRVTIVGLGLMGGSLALALRPHVAWLTAVDRDRATLRSALDQGIVNRATADLADGVAGADLVILAVPVRAIIELLAKLPQVRPDGCLVIDLGSTKEQVCASMARLPATIGAMGGHPMCGRESAGLAAATAGLYRDQTFVLCRNERTTPEVERQALALVAAVGARPLVLPADVHDALVAVTSHLPYLVSSLLMQVAATAPDGQLLRQVVASGFRDTTRLSGSQPDMMLDILLTNRTAIIGVLKAYQQELASLLALLESKDESALKTWLIRAQQGYRDFRKADQARE